MYIDEGYVNLRDTSMAPFGGKESDCKNGVRCMQISPDGQLIATGDRSGNLRFKNDLFLKATVTESEHDFL